jgi:hypothetical protein
LLLRNFAVQTHPASACIAENRCGSAKNSKTTQKDVKSIIKEMQHRAIPYSWDVTPIYLELSTGLQHCQL